MIPVRTVAVALIAALAGGGLVTPVIAQVAAPKLSKPQRLAFEAIVEAVDRAAAGAPDVPLDTATWITHVLRASDGSHYVALHADLPAVDAPSEPVPLYVRFAARRVGAETALPPARSAVADWLKGLRGDPLPMRASRSTTVPQGEIPVGGAAVLAGDAGVEASNVLRLQDIERDRARREAAAREKQRRAELESRLAAPPTPLHPFEDLDLRYDFPSSADGTFLERGASVGPGDYDVFIGWAAPAGRNRVPQVHVLRHRITLPGANAVEFALSDVILADRVRALEAPVPADQQGAHPYAIGALDTVPAHDTRFRVDEPLSVVTQVINPSTATAGKPDVELSARVSRVVAGRDELVGTLPVHQYNAATLPADFDVAAGHPLFAALQVPLTSFARGHYALTLTALDRIGRRQAVRRVEFDVTGTPDSLLREAPTPGQAFRRDAALAPPTLAAVVRALRPATPSEPLARALDAAAAGRFAELMRVDTVPPTERAVAQALLGLGLYGLGDSARATAAQLSQAANLGAPAPPVLVLLGATYALGNDDKAAVTAWNQAREGGIDDAAVAGLLIDAYLRQGDVARAAAMATAALDTQPGNLAARHALAATYLATRRHGEALTLLDAVPEASATPETRFLTAEALYAAFVRHDTALDTPASRARFTTVAGAYVAEGGPHAALVREWLAALPPASR